ncbi:MAG: DUF1844 domain-containing protein [Candidatus Sumerlaeota bacterium]|nr:DUF1844 domain-containing protein [Candidatus Sumerlaeota bacterium]
MKNLLTLSLLLALTLCPALAPAGDETDETRLKLMELNRKIKDQELQLKDLDQKDVEYRKQAQQYKEFLELRNKDNKYFDKIVSETKAAVEKSQQELETCRADQQKYEDRLDRWLKMFALSATGDIDKAGAQPGRVNALVMLRAQCRQLVVQAQLAREAQVKAQERLQSLYETRERYEAFSKFAGASASTIEINLKLGKQRMDAIAALKEKGQQSISLLEKERQQLDSLLASLKMQLGPNGNTPGYEQSLKEPPKPLAGLAQPPATGAAGTGNAPGANNTGSARDPNAPKSPPSPGATDSGTKTPDATALAAKSGGKATAGSPPGPPTAETAFTNLLTAPPNTPVLAVESGHVWFAGPFEGWGNLVVIHHKDDMVSVYGYLADIAVRANINVYKGQEIGWVGPLKTSSKYGVSFEVRRGTDETRAIDPAKWKPSSGDLKAILLGKTP